MIIKNPLFIDGVIKNRFLDQKAVLQCMGPESNAFLVLKYLIEMNIFSRQQAVRYWCDAFGVAWIDLEASLFQHDIVKLLPEDLAKRYCAIPVYRMGEIGTSITVALADAGNRNIIAQLEKQIGMPISVVGALPDEILDAISVQYQSIDDLECANEKMVGALRTTLSTELDRKKLETLAGDQGIVQLTNTLFLLAVRDNASDIHIEPNDNHTLVRFRIDGLLQPRIKLAREIHLPIISRIKIMANMDITERRKPQDGRLSLPLAQRALDFRVSTVPTQYGEKAVLRILGRLKNKDVPNLEELYFSKKIHAQIQRLVTSPNGVFFMTGPTGSGKSTTLFSALKKINTSEINIMTIEDPVEYRLPGITQVQVNTAAGLTFSSALRAFLRQDPDVILVGEIRDLETAKIATEAALTGHLVLASLHANGALQATTRLIDIGVEPFMVGPSLIGVLSQRLVRRICDDCKESYRPDRAILDDMFEWDGQREIHFFRGKGCDRCGGSGYKGRIGIHEMVMITDEIRRLVTKGESDDQIRVAAERSGFQNLRYDGIKKVLRGLTTLEEVNRVAPWD